MLIKHKRLTKAQGPHKVTHLEVSETARATQLEIHKAKQEAKAIRQEAENILEDSKNKLREAEAKAKEIINEANKKATEIKETVRKETLDRANKEANQIKEKAKQLLAELFEVKREALSQAHEEIIKVALDLSEKVIKYQASIDPEILKTQVVESIKKATAEADRVQVFVNPADLESLEKSIPELVKLFPSGVEIVPLSNDSVEQGSCVVETKSGQLDATFSTQLKALTELMTTVEVEPPQINIEEPSLIEDAQVQEEISPQNELEELQIEEAVTTAEQESNLLIQDEEVDEENLVEKAEIKPQESSLTKEEEGLKKELLGDEPLINLLEDEEERFPFQEKAKAEPKIQREEVKAGEKIEEIKQVPEEIAEKIKEEVKPPVEEESRETKKKKIFADTRTKEEADELDEAGEVTEGNLELELEEEEEEELKKEEVQTKSILKPKKPQQSSDVSNIAQDIEKNPEWKNLIQDEDEE